MGKSKAFQIFLVAVFLLGCSCLTAQVASTKDSLVWKYDVTASGFISNDGNQRLLFNNLGSLIVSGPIWSNRTVVNYQVGTIARKVKENDVLAFDIFRLFPQDKYFPLIMTGMELNKTRAIDFRWFAGIGGGVHILRKDKLQVEFTTSVLYERTNFDAALRDNSMTAFSFNKGLWRISPRIFGFFELTQGLRFEYESWIQPAFSQFSDYRAFGNIALLLPIAKKLYVRVGWLLTYESVVIDPSPNSDSIINVGITLKN